MRPAGSRGSAARRRVARSDAGRATPRSCAARCRDRSGRSRKSRRIVPTYRRYHRPSSRLSAFRDIRMARSQVVDHSDGMMKLQFNPWGTGRRCDQRHWSAGDYSRRLLSLAPSRASSRDGMRVGAVHPVRAYRDRGFESGFLQRGVYCELDSRLPAAARPDCDRLHVRSGSCSNHSVRRRRRGRGNRRRSYAGQDWRPDCRFVSSALVWLAKVTPTSLGVALVSRVCPKTST